jgi:hypothetical protein
VSELLDQLPRLLEMTTSPSVAPHGCSGMLQVLQGLVGQVQGIGQAVGEVLWAGAGLQSVPLLSHPCRLGHVRGSPSPPALAAELHSFPILRGIGLDSALGTTLGTPAIAGGHIAVTAGWAEVSERRGISHAIIVNNA